MSSIKAASRETISLQLKSLLIYDFLKSYNLFEKYVRNAFEASLPTLSTSTMQQMYFLLGGRIGTYIEYQGPCIKLTSISYKDDEQFKNFSVNQIIRLFKVSHCVEAFEFEIVSLQRPRTSYPFIDCAIKLINMRNKLAHELEELHFKDSDLIELLSLDNIRKEPFELLQNYDIGNLDDSTKYIASNIIYMRRLIQHLEEIIS